MDGVGKISSTFSLGDFLDHQREWAPPRVQDALPSSREERDVSGGPLDAKQRDEMWTTSCNKEEVGVLKGLEERGKRKYLYESDLQVLNFELHWEAIPSPRKGS